MNIKNTKKKLLIFIVAYNAEKTIAWVLNRIPIEINKNFNVEVLIIDDQSSDKTSEVGKKYISTNNFKFAIKILYNPINQGYGGNQKLGYFYAIKNNFDYVALIHGDGQYPPEHLPKLMQSFSEKNVEAVFGSRMLQKGGALKGGMPLYKFVGNKILTKFENLMLNTKFSEFHSGYRVYSVKALSKIPFNLNTNDFHFDTQIIIQFVFSGFSIKEIPIPTYYGKEISRVNGIKYALNVFLSIMIACSQKLNLFYDRKYDLLKESTYLPKFNFYSPHKLVIDKIPNLSKVLDIGCGGGFIGKELKLQKKCFVFGVDFFSLDKKIKLDNFIKYDLEKGMPKSIKLGFDFILLLDILEHLSEPEKFLDEVYEFLKLHPNTKIYASTGNVAFFITRLSLLLGNFNYSKKGILDITHKRLFTKKSFANLFYRSGFNVTKVIPIPGPWVLIFGDNFFGHLILNFNNILCKLLPGLFAYQFFLEVKPKNHLDYLLKTAKKIS